MHAVLRTSFFHLRVLLPFIYIVICIFSFDLFLSGTFADVQPASENRPEWTANEDLSGSTLKLVPRHAEVFA